MTIKETTFEEFLLACIVPAQSITQEQHDQARRELGFPVKQR